jgi:hypothetical protein
LCVAEFNIGQSRFRLPIPVSKLSQLDPVNSSALTKSFQVEAKTNEVVELFKGKEA